MNVFKHSWISVLKSMLFIVSSIVLIQASWIPVKAWIAQHMLQNAWEATLETPEHNHLPWPWADTWPVASMDIPRLNKHWVVLEGVSGEALSFGPGMLTTSPATPSAHLNSAPQLTPIIAGHRDTHFSAIQYLKGRGSCHSDEST